MKLNLRIKKSKYYTVLMFKIPIIFILLCGLITPQQSFAQLPEIGFGYSFVQYTGSEIDPYNMGYSPSGANYWSVSDEIAPTGNFMLGLYYHLIAFSTEASLGVHYQATGFIGEMDDYFNVKFYGIDLPIMAELRFGGVATEASRSTWGFTAGGGMMYTGIVLNGNDNVESNHAFKQVYSFGIQKSITGFQFAFHPGHYIFVHQSNTDNQIRADFVKYHITYTLYLGEF